MLLLGHDDNRKMSEEKEKRMSLLYQYILYNYKRINHAIAPAGRAEQSKAKQSEIKIPAGKTLRMNLAKVASS